MISRWMIRIFRLVKGPVHPYEADVSFVSSSVHLWDTFVESPAVVILLSCTGDHEITVNDWQEQLRIAFRLCRDMDREDSVDLPKILFILRPLIVGTYQAEQGVTVTNQDTILLHALIGIDMSRSCPTCILDWIVTTFPEQLRTVNPVTGQLPLAAVCASSNSTAEQVSTILTAYPQAAAIADSSGGYPLHLVCRNEGLTWENGIRQVFLAAPQVLRFPTAHGGQCLFVAMALNHAERVAAREVPMPLNVTNTLFEILRCDPAIVRDFMTDE